MWPAGRWLAIASRPSVAYPLLGIAAAGYSLVAFELSLAHALPIGISVAVDQWMGSAADPSSSVVSFVFTPIFFVVAAITLIPVYFYFRGMSRT